MPAINYSKTLRDLNRRNREFWEKQNRLTATRMSNPAISQVALEELKSEELRGVPLYFRKSLDKTLEDAERIMALGCSELSRRGGRAPKPDALQQVIMKHVRKRPCLTESELVELLKDNRRTFGVNEEEVYFDKPNGAQKSVPISALKDRLYRAKRKISSR